jgi:hypothetical protein
MKEHPRACIDPFPFVDHRTLEEVQEEESRRVREARFRLARARADAILRQVGGFGPRAP